MASIKLDTSKVERVLGEIQVALKAISTRLPTEAEAWQSEDMRRKYPNIRQSGRSRFYISIWPTSRKRMVRTRQNIRGVSVKRSRKRVKVFFRGKILRDSMRVMLRERMIKQLIGIVPWEST